MASVVQDHINDPVSEGAANVVAPLTFIVPQAEKPALYSAAFTGGAPDFRFAVEDHDVLVADMRPHAGSFTLDKEGFALRTVPTETADLYDDATVGTGYFDEIRSLLMEEFDASQVAIFDATRRSDGGKGASNKDGNRGPAPRIHVDYTAKSGPQRARDVFGADAFDGLLNSGARILQVNVWRPIRGPVQRSPLALADATSVKAADLVATDQVFPDRVGEIYHLSHDKDQRWYYVPEMTRDEVLLIKGWDSIEDGRAQFTPHSAFPLPTQTNDTPARESIEVRTFVVIE
ncbi:CmcJ/NvfI family oxidoreductase [Nisaea nitritireducens]|uniref:CmcJ/NvfI family oxidoreductase n=1 Tax=Nisaea nitritireducens TaxID=568392 RepID=UPI001867871F|nr:CmcJ/NvfI family oxidoreductase [Nisaea nitritireducens]